MQATFALVLLTQFCKKTFEKEKILAAFFEEGSSVFCGEWTLAQMKEKTSQVKSKTKTTTHTHTNPTPDFQFQRIFSLALRKSPPKELSTGPSVAFQS